MRGRAKIRQVGEIFAGRGHLLKEQLRSVLVQEDINKKSYTISNNLLTAIQGEIKHIRTVLYI